MIQIKNYINGEFVEPISKKYFDNFEPASTQVYSQVPDSDSADVQKAIEAAKQAFKSWSELSKKERAHFLNKISNAITEKLEMLAIAESRDTGKPLKLCKTLDIPRSAQNFSFFAEMAETFSDENYLTENLAMNQTVNAPLGVVGCISPWNLPLYLFSWKIAPALAAGNCVVAKPSEVTPMTAFLLAEICHQVGLPKGVLNIVHGFGPKIGPELISNKEVKAISFTGSTKTGAEIAKQASLQFKKVSLEMGGKNPTIIFADCDFSETVKMAVRSSFLNQGQICLCGSRILIEKSIYEKFKEAFVAATQKLKMGNPSDTGTDQGVLVSEVHFKKVMSHIEVAKSEGGKIILGGVKGELPWSVQPTIIEGLGPQCRTNQEEIFGPVVTLQSFSTLDEAIALANSTNYGLAASVWTEDKAKAQIVAEQVQSGIVWVNTWMLRDLRTPFGGVKDSGFGREGGKYAMDFFTSTKNICTKLHSKAGLS